MLKKLLMLLLCCTMIAACAPASAETYATVLFALDGFVVGGDPNDVTISTYPYDLDIASVQVVDTGFRPLPGSLEDRGAYFLRVALSLDSNGNVVDRNGNVVIDFAGNKNVYLDFHLTNGVFLTPDDSNDPSQFVLVFNLDCPVAKSHSFTIQNYEYGRSVADLVVTEDIPDAELCYHNQIPGWMLYNLDTLTPVTSGTLKADTRYLLVVATHYAKPETPPRGGYPRLYPGITSTINQGSVIMQNFQYPHEDFYGFLLDPLKAPAPTPTPVPVPTPPATGDGLNFLLWLAVAGVSMEVVLYLRRRKRG
ncbi:MAG: LPXTG cell wall anchor domain-containing protein [Clostridia bacterium]|nr:LPXTG cell wall anchor domain-containing protein [Clostridia bacterium]